MRPVQTFVPVTEQMFGVGLRFCATEEELIQLLKMKAQGTDITGITRGYVLEKTLYGRGRDKLPWNVFTAADEEKWRLYDNLGQNTGKNESKRIIYVVTKLSRMSAKKVVRSAGFGTWDGQTRPEPIKNSQGIKIGSMKSLNYQIESEYESEAVDKGYWYLHEYNLSKESLREIGLRSTDYVICRIIKDIAKTCKVKSSKVDNKTARARGGGDGRGGGGFGDEGNGGSPEFDDEKPNPPEPYDGGFGNNFGMNGQNGYTGSILPKKEAPACYFENRCYPSFGAANQNGMNYGLAMKDGCGSSGSTIPPQKASPSCRYLANQRFDPIGFEGFQCNYVGNTKSECDATSTSAPMEDMGCHDRQMANRLEGLSDRYNYVGEGMETDYDATSTSVPEGKDFGGNNGQWSDVINHAGNHNSKSNTNDNVIEKQSYSDGVEYCGAVYSENDQIPPLVIDDDENINLDEFFMSGSKDLATTDKGLENNTIDRMLGLEPDFRNAFGGMFGVLLSESRSEPDVRNIEQGTFAKPKVCQGNRFPQTCYR